jgi:hypothetical protein
MVKVEVTEFAPGVNEAGDRPQVGIGARPLTEH